MKPIVFGTSGWRGPVGREVTPARMEALARAIVRWLWKRTGQANAAGGSIRVLVGQDTRLHSEWLEKTLARSLLSHEGVSVAGGIGETPTPGVAWGVSCLQFRADLGLVVTASHNPPSDNGLKILMPDGRLCPDDVAAEILGLVDETLPRTRHPHPGMREVDLASAYAAALRALVPPPPRTLSLIVDPMHGAGRRVLPEVFEGWGRVVGVRTELDPSFGGVPPDPRPETLGGLARAVVSAGADLGLAVDGDGDRFGVVDAAGAFVPPHRLMPLLIEDLLLRGPRGPVARSVCTTHIIDEVARAHRTPVVETAVGFKHLGTAMAEESAVIACEESGGFAWAPHIPTKDGILACLLVADLVARRRAPLHELIADFEKRFPPRPFARLDRPMNPVLLARLKEDPPAEIAGRRVESIARRDGLKFNLSDGSWVLVRKAGTERILRWYAESRRPKDLPILLAAVERIEAERSGGGKSRPPVSVPAMT